VTGPATGEPDRGTGAPTRTTGTRETVSAIVIVLALGLAFRLILAQALPGSGFRNDLYAFQFWAWKLTELGPFGFYHQGFFLDYTPGYLYVLWMVGWVGRLLGVTGPVGLGDLIKVPPILADLVLAWLVARMVRELGGSRRASLAAAVIVVVNPITWFDSVVWGQVDSVGVIFLVLAVRELWRDHPERSAVFTVIAAIIKPQLGILVPIVAAVTIRRAFWPSGAYGSDPPPERPYRGPVRVVTTALVGLLSAVALSLPFGLSLPELGSQIASAAGGYPYLSVNAYNPWALLELDGVGIARNGGWVCDVAYRSASTGADCPEGFMFGAIPAVAVGTVLLLIAVAAITLVIARRPDRLTILVGVAVLSLAFFVLPTRVHERYLYPLYGAAAILAGVSLRWRAFYVLAGIATFANMYVVLTTLYDNPSVDDWLGIGPGIRSAAGVALVAAIHLLAFVWACTQLSDGALERLRTEVSERLSWPDLAGREPRRVFEPAGSPGTAIARSVPAAGRLAPVALSASPGYEATGVYPLPVWRQPGSWVELGLWGWFRDRVSQRPIRPDRTALLAREPGGRLDRLDVWIVAVLLVSVLGVRLWRLAEPYRMHFDEVYHARTATEFLQDWRYGIDHDIYEWTHPHLAKYAMALGLVALGDDKVTGSADLKTPIRDAVVEPRWDDGSHRAGDRLHVATGSEVRSYDLRTKELIATTSIPGATALTVDPANHLLFVGTDSGEILTLDLQLLDTDRTAGVQPSEVEPGAIAKVDGPITRLHASADGSALFAQVGDGTLVSIDPLSGQVLGQSSLPGIAAMADAGATPALVANVADVPDRAAAASELADLLGGEPADYETRLNEAQDRLVVASVPASGEPRTAVDTAIEDGKLTGFEVESIPRLAVADSHGVTFVSSAGGSVVQTLVLPGGAHGLATVTGLDDPKLYVTAGSASQPKVTIIDTGGKSGSEQATTGDSIALPAPATWVGYNSATQEVHVLGRQPTDGSGPFDRSGDGWTVYSIETHANAVFADASLPFEPIATTMDTNELYPSSDREQVLAVDAAGQVAAVDIGSHPFAWRLPGVFAGALMAVLLYLLARILFKRRSVALIAGLLTLVDGMLFVQSRIGMNDAYVGLFIVAAYALFAALWTGALRWRGTFWVTMPVIGVLLGLALASKWVAAYAIGALGILILARSALGRLVLIGGLVVATTALGYLAMWVPDKTPASAGWQLPFGLVLQGNLTFTLIMIGLTAAAVVAAVLHPIRWSTEETWFAVAAPGGGGIVLVLAALALGKAGSVFRPLGFAVTPLEVGFALVGLAIVAAAGLWLAGRSGFGPFARPPDPEDPARLLEPAAEPPEGWLRPGWALGLPVVWMVCSLLVIPVAVYVASYLPWAFLDGHRILDNWPPGHMGQTLLDLTGQMYNYHNTLADAHAASSPWWAWPFDFKPVWFFQQSFAGNTAASIYDAGNLAIWWLGIPAMAFCAWQAYRRRSLALALITIGFAAQWVSWARIDRAAFQYHYYTSLPFVVLVLAYFLAELWHGASRRTWLLARLSAAAAVLGPAALWLFHRPLCGFVRVTDVNPGSQACPTSIPEFVLTGRTLGLAVVVGLAVLVIVWQFVRLGRQEVAPGSAWQSLVPLLVSAGVAFVGLLIATYFVGDEPIFALHNVPVEPVAFLVGMPLFALAVAVATARDARRFVVGTLSTIVAVFLVFYPNIAALPLPSTIVNAYQGVLPTYVYPFQFPVSTVARNVKGPSLFGSEPALLLVGLVFLCVVLAFSAHSWRLALAERRRYESGLGDEGEAAASGPAFAPGGGGQR
jgi:4-amino-4-deoxy-L-arabinose transferase-like glycosyltransferase